MQIKPLVCFFILAACVPAQARADEAPATPQFKKCLDAAGGVTATSVQCIGAEIDRQDVVLNRNYKKAMTLLSAERKQSLMKAQRAWLAYRAAQCSFEFDPNGGTMAHIISTDCVRTMTAERARFLGTIDQ